MMDYKKQRSIFMKKRVTGILTALAVSMTALTGCAQSTPLDGSVEVMSVDGVSVPLGELNFYLRYQQTQMQGFYGAYFGEDFMNQDLMGTGTVYGETIRDSVVEMLQEYYLVEAAAEELGVSLSEEEKTAANDAAKAFLAANDSKTLEVMTADEATVSHVLELMALQSKAYANRAATIDTEVAEEDIAQKRISYVKNSIAATTDEDGNEVALTEEEIAAKKEVMETILAKAKESEDLSAAAEEQELSASSTTYGISDTSLGEEVKAAADALEDGEFSEVIETEDAYYVVYMESTFDEEATEQAKESVLNEREQEAYDTWLDSIKEEADITVAEDVVKTLTFERVFNLPEEEATEEVENTESGDAEAEDTEEVEDTEAENTEEAEDTQTTE